MRHVFIHADSPHHSLLPDHAEVIPTSSIPTRKELKLLDAVTTTILPNDPTPSLEDIAKQPDVAHLSTPVVAPQREYLEDILRVVVLGSDAALAAVLTRLMRSDSLWCEVGYVPTDPQSYVALGWDLPKSSQEALDFAIEAPMRPLPLIRDDAAQVVAGHAEITAWDAREITGEIIVDDTQLLLHQAGRRTPRTGIFGARLVPTLDAPGLAAVVLNTPVQPVTHGFFHRPSKIIGSADATTLRTGRALQAGGVELRVSIDGVSRKRAVERATFYRHLRDLQAVRR